MENSLVIIFCLLGVASCNLQPISWERADASIYADGNATEPCIELHNLSRPIAGVQRPFFGKADIQPGLTLKLTVQLPKTGFSYVNISLDADPDNKNVAIGLTFTQKGHSLFMKTGNTPKVLRTGTQTLALDKTHVIEISVFETGPGWGKYAFLVKVNGSFFCILEEQPGLEVLFANYISVIQSVNVQSVELCAGHV